MQVAATSEVANDGYLIPLGSLVTNFGGDSPALLFVQLSGSLGDGGLNNVFRSNGNPVDLTGRQFNLYGRIIYECADTIENILTISDNFATPGTVGEVYSSTVAIETSTNMQFPINMNQPAGSVPVGLNLEINDAEITLSGTPTEVDSDTFTIEITDSLGSIFTKEFTVIVEAAEVVTPLSINIPGDWSGAQQFHQFSETIIIELENQGLQSPVTMSVIAGNLPSSYGLNYSPTSYKLKLNGNSDDAGTYNFTVRLTDALGTVYDKNMSCTVFADSAPTTNPELDPQYLGTWSPNSHNINFDAGGNALLTGVGVNYSATNGDILKIRSASANIDYLGASTYHVEIGDYIQYFGSGGTNGSWQYMGYS